MSRAELWSYAWTLLVTVGLVLAVLLLSGEL